MQPFATEDDMENRTLGAITATSHPFLPQEIAAAVREIRNHCGWHVAPTEVLTYRREAPWAEDVWLPAMQITAITACVIDGRAIDPATIRFDPDTGWTNLRGCSVHVTYVAGYSDVPEDLVTLALELAAGGLGTSLGIGREQAGGVSVTYTRANGSVQSSDHGRLAAYTLGTLP